MAMSDRHRTGNALTGVLFLLLLLAAAGAWNYHRNLQIEQAAAAARPYESYATADLEALRKAYVSELASVQAELAHSKSKRGEVSRNHGSIARNVEQFAQTTVTSSAIRRAAANVAERQSQIGELDTELELRERFGQGMSRHVKLLVGVEGLFTG
jgi:hypothetical protein